MSTSDETSLPPPRRGRPRVQEPKTTVSTWLPATEHDRLISIARRNDLSVSSLVRQLLVIGLKRR